MFAKVNELLKGEHKITGKEQFTGTDYTINTTWIRTFLKTKTGQDGDIKTYLVYVFIRLLLFAKTMSA